MGGEAPRVHGCLVVFCRGVLAGERGACRDADAMAQALRASPPASNQSIDFRILRLVFENGRDWCLGFGDDRECSGFATLTCASSLEVSKVRIET